MLLCVIVGPLFRVVAKFGRLINGELEVEPRAAIEECMKDWSCARRLALQSPSI